VSTGVGGAIVSEGRIFHGPDGTAGANSAIHLWQWMGLCTCGAVGHLEGIVSGAGMAQIARAIVAEGGSPFLAARVAQKGVHAIEARDIARARMPVTRPAGRSWSGADAHLPLRASVSSMH